VYKIIRCGARYDLVIVVTPADANPETQDAKYYRAATWDVGGPDSEKLHEIDAAFAMTYFSGQADGLGFECAPPFTFGSLAEVQQFISERRTLGVPSRTQEEFRRIVKTLYIPKFPYHNFPHAANVYQETLDIIQRCQAENVPVNKIVVYFSALGHDLGYGLNHRALGYPTKEALAADWTGRIMFYLGIDPEIILLTKGAIQGTQKDAAVLTNEAKILRAADLAELAKDLPTFVRNNRLLKEEWELLNGKKISWPDWKTQTKKIVEFFLSQDIRLTSYHDDQKGNSRFHVAARKILDEYMVLPESALL